uniref:DNA-directed DNA polymerase n=1 Tax=viral metagenome TaxID=1070528 RepID=A0A6M3JKB9_9ZZZZ
MRANFACHRVKQNHATHVPAHRIFLDVETRVIEDGDIKRLPFRFGVTCYEYKNSQRKNTQSVWKTHHTTKEMFDYIVSKAQASTKLYLFAHNISFDAISCALLKHLTEANWKLGFYYSKGLVYILSTKSDKKKIVLLSTTNYFPCSVKALGAMLNLPKLDADFINDDETKLIEYCTRDVEIIRKAVLLWFDIIMNNDYGGFKMTTASQALAAFRHRFMSHPIYPHNETDIKELERRSYFGGRVECFYVGKYEDGPFVKLDFNSNYASVMIKEAYPTNLAGVFESVSVDRLKELLDSYLVIADVVINTDLPLYPTRCGQKLLFPVGEFKCTLCSKSLSEAIKRGHLVKVTKTAAYVGKLVFKSFIEHFFPLKQKYDKDGEKILRTIFKLIMNSLYGKFAERHKEIIRTEEFGGKLCYRELEFVFGENKRTLKTKLLNTVFEEGEEVDSKHMFTAISSHVTDYARWLLWEAFEKIGLGNQMYCDTDSIICRKSVIKNIPDLLHPDKIGYLSIEAEADSVELVNPKHYKFGDELKIKGIPSKAVLIKENTYQYESFARDITLIKAGNLTEVYIKQVVKVLSGKYNKGKVNESGKVEPFELPTDALLLPI